VGRSFIGPASYTSSPGTRLDLCGNGLLDVGEPCEDAKRFDGDGCTGRCALELGWRCLTPGALCGAAACGDGVIAGGEVCDDGNATARSGRAATASDSGS
jgi:cysteine-rich repeat protein